MLSGSDWCYLTFGHPQLHLDPADGGKIIPNAVYISLFSHRRWHHESWHDWWTGWEILIAPDKCNCIVYFLEPFLPRWCLFYGLTIKLSYLSAVLTRDYDQVRVWSRDGTPEPSKIKPLVAVIHGSSGNSDSTSDWCYVRSRTFGYSKYTSQALWANF